jgi:HSP20 family protein
MANEVIRWDPFREVLSLRDAMDRLFEESFVAPRFFYSPDTYRRMNALPVNMYETPDEVIVNAVLPGLKTQDVNLEFQDGRLIIDVQIPAPQVENVTWHYRELASGQYHREITLPIAVNTDKIEATLENGLLTLRLPKAEEVKPKKIQIQTVSGSKK